MKAMQSPCPCAGADGSLGEPEGPELLGRYDPMLATRQLRDLVVARVNPKFRTCEVGFVGFTGHPTSVAAASAPFST
jgi:hypothetical protein